MDIRQDQCLQIAYPIFLVAYNGIKMRSSNTVFCVYFIIWINTLIDLVYCTYLYKIVMLVPTVCCQKFKVFTIILAEKRFYTRETIRGIRISRLAKIMIGTGREE